MTAPRFILRLFLCLALGLLTTVALAWASVTFVLPSIATSAPYSLNKPRSNPEFGGYRFSRPGMERVSWGLLFYAGGGAVAYDPATGKIRNPDARMIHWAQEALPFFQPAHLFPLSWGSRPRVEPNDNESRRFEWIQDARGWPMLAFWCEWQDDTKTYSSGPVAGGIELPRLGIRSGDPFETVRALPYRPISFGLAADTFVFALAWSALLFAPRAIRRHLRLRRGLCPACGYDLSRLPPGAACPECGGGKAAHPAQQQSSK